MTVLLAVVGGLGLAGVMGINVLERTREIGILRSIGGTSTRIQSIIITEAIVIGVISWFLGLLLAVPLSRLLCDFAGMAFIDDPLRYQFSTLGVWLWLLVTIALAAVSSFLPAQRASQISIREALIYE